MIGRAGIGLDAIDLAGRGRGRRRGHQLPRLRHQRGRDARRRAAARAAATARRGRPAGARALGRAVVAGRDGTARDAHARTRRPRPHRPRDGGAHAAAGRRDPGLRPGLAAAARRREPLRQPRELLESSDLVSLHLPLLPETEKLLGPEQFERMRPGALLVNVSRGGLIDEDALADALERGADRRRRARRLRARAAGRRRAHPRRRPTPCSRRTSRGSRPHPGPKVRRDTVEAMIVWIESGTVPRGNLAARPLRTRAEAVAGGVS